MFFLKRLQKKFLILIICLVFLFSFFYTPQLQGAKKKKGKKIKFAVNPNYLKVLKWRSIGPHRGGRVIAVAGHPFKTNVFYFGGTGSGVWKTENGGKTWENISDGFFKTSSVGAISISETDPQVIYVGMGECCLRGNISHGDGVYKSIDGGKSWVNMGLSSTRHISRICIHPKDCNIVYVAAFGHAFGPNMERGLFRSINGGKRWKKILFRSEKAGAIDLVMNPENPRILYVAFWEAQRYPWGFVSSGPGSSIYKSVDGGDSWKEITNNPGIPEGIKGRIGLTISGAKSDRIWAIIEAKKKGVYCSDDGGKNWKLMSSNPQLFQRPWYYHHIKADPNDKNTLYVMNVGFWKSINKGKTFSRIRTPHGDNHDLWIDPRNSLRMIEGNDGGATVTFDGGTTWSSIYNQPTAQFYHVTTDQQFPYRVYGAQQDNSTISVPSRSARGTITSEEWYSVGGCECGYIAVHPKDKNIVYAGCYGGMLTRYDHRLKQTRDISVWPDNPMGWGAKDLKYRFQWTFPILLSHFDPGVLYVAGNYVFRSTNEGKSWNIISPDLTRKDKSKMDSSGGSLTKDNTSVEYYGTIFSLAESPLKKDLLWAGSDDGLIHISFDGGKNWKNVTPKNIPEWSLISIIEPSHHNPATAYIAATRYKLDDFSPYLYKTSDFGKTWKKITSGIPSNDFTRVIREDPNKKELLFAGTETGIYLSLDYGKQWQPLLLNLPITPIHDMVIYNNDLIVATHGRSFWILDDLTKLYQLKEIKTLPSNFLFKPKKSIRFRGRYRKKAVNAGETLPVGVIVNYYFKDKPKEQVTLSFLDKNKKLIRKFMSKSKKKKEPTVPTKAGMNRFVWNLRYPSAHEVPGAVFWGPGNVSPVVVPGIYYVRLSVGKEDLEKSFEVIKDPRFLTTLKEYGKQFDLLFKIREKLSETHDAVNEIRNIRKQVEWWVNRSKKKPYKNKISKASKSINEKLKSIEDDLIQHRAKAHQDLLNYPIKLNNKLTALAGVVERSEGVPNQQAYDFFKDLSAQIDSRLNKLKEIINIDVVTFNRLVKKLDVPAIILKHLKTDK